MGLQRLDRMRKDESGSMTVFGLFMIITCVIVGGLAMDFMNGVKTKTELQVAADSAAHAALMARNYGKNEDEAKQVGLAVGNMILSRSGISDTLIADDIQFGDWDAAAQVFQADPSQDDAVLVSAQRLAERNTALATGFLRFIGLYNFDVRSQSVFETYIPTCTREGFFAEDRVDVQSNNNFSNGFCIHSNQHVEMNIDNAYSSNVVVSMPDETDVILPSSGWDKNPGLVPALRDGAYAIPILYRIQEIIANLSNPSSKWFRGDYLDIDPLTAVPDEVIVAKNDKLKDVWVEGAVHRRTCNAANQKVTFDANQTFKKGVLITNCKVEFGAYVTLIDVAVATTNDDVKSITAASNLTLGLDDGCANGGGAQIVTMGGLDLASNMSAYGAQILALDDVNFAADADGIEGISIVSGGEIDSTSGIEMGFCNGAGMSNNWLAEYFRMAT